MLEAKDFLMPGGATVNPQDLSAKDILPGYVVRGTLPGFAERFNALLDYFREDIKFKRRLEYPEGWMDHYAAVGEALERCKFHDALLRLARVSASQLKASVPLHGWTRENKELLKDLEWVVYVWPDADELPAIEQIRNLKKRVNWIHAVWSWLLGDA